MMMSQKKKNLKFLIDLYISVKDLNGPPYAFGAFFLNIVVLIIYDTDLISTKNAESAKKDSANGANAKIINFASMV